MTDVSLKHLPRLLQAAGIVQMNPDLVRLALTHSSKNKKTNNERLEFLGDRVISLALADMIYAAYPNENEGDLALRHAALARMEVLADIARTYDLGSDMIVAGDSSSGGSVAGVDNVLADGVEALMGALYLDQGYAVCHAAVAVLWADILTDMVAPPRDPKTIIQEWTQSRGFPLPVYAEIGRSGPDHAPEFQVELRIKGFDPVVGTGASRRLAEKSAAVKMMESISNNAT